MNGFGSRVKARREIAGLTQSELAKMAGLEKRQSIVRRRAEYIRALIPAGELQKRLIARSVSCWRQNRSENRR